MARPRKIVENQAQHIDYSDQSVAVTTAPPRVTVVKRRDIIERRLANPLGSGSRPIPAKAKDREGKPLVEFYIADRNLRPDYLHYMIADRGWEYATVDDIEGSPEDFGFEPRDGRLVRGERGNEVLLKMTKADRDAVLAAQSAFNRRQALGIKETKQAIVEGASRELGDEPADFLNRSISGLEITDTMERIPEDER